jgi:tetratricopeptide (TPR) repeat protein
MREAKPILLALLAFCLLAARTLAGGEGFDAANRAYDEGRFAEAKAGYERLVEAGEHSANLFYNLGNADYRLGATGRAILDYERALALDPAHPEARANLALLRKQTGAHQRATVWQDKLFVSRSLDLWTIVLAVAGWLTLVWLVLIMTSRRAEKAGLWTVTLASAFLCAYAGGVIWWRSPDQALAVVVAGQMEARKAPADSAPLVEALPTGSSVRVRSERGEWIECALPGGGVGWIPRAALERVRLDKA